MYPSPRLRTHTHTHKVEVARELAPNRITSLPQDDLFSYLRMVSDAGLELPTKSKACLVRVFAGECVEAAMVNAMFASKLVDAIKCWGPAAHDAAFDPMNKQTWLLQNISLTAQAKTQWFQDTVFDKFLLPLVDQGEEKSAQVHKFCKLMLASWDESEDDNLSDETITTLEVTLRVWRCIVNIIEMAPQIMTETDYDLMEFLKAKKSSSEQSPEVSISIALHDSEWYKKRMDALVNYKGALMRHSQAMREDMNLIEMSADGFSKEMATKLEKMCINMCTYRNELPSLVYSSLEGRAVTKIVRFMTSALEVDNLAFDGIESLGRLANEAGLAFSLEAEVSGLVERVQARQASVAATSKSAFLLQLIDEVCQLEQGSLEGHCKCAALVHFLCDNWQAKVDDEQRVSISKVCDKIFDELHVMCKAGKLDEKLEVLKLLDVLIPRLSEFVKQQNKGNTYIHTSISDNNENKPQGCRRLRRRHGNRGLGGVSSQRRWP